MTDPSKVKVGDILTIVHYAKVTSKNGNTVAVSDLDNQQPFEINGSPLIEKCLTPDQFTSTKKVTKTEAAELLVSAYNKPLKVLFVKEDKTEREMRCRLIKPEPLLGRSMVDDLDIDSGHKMRQIDHRTIKWLILDGTKYEVKVK